MPIKGNEPKVAQNHPFPSTDICQFKVLAPMCQLAYLGPNFKHVDYILNQIIKKIQTIILKRKKIEVKPTTIKEQLMLFLRCDIENPGFDSQTKDYMNTTSNKFGSRCEPSDNFCEKSLESSKSHCGTLKNFLVFPFPIHF